MGFPGMHVVSRCEPVLGGAAILRSGYFVSEGNNQKRITLVLQCLNNLDCCFNVVL